MAEQRTAASPYPIRPGSRFPNGATAGAEGVNFCIFSRHARRVELLLYAAADSPAPLQTIVLDPEYNRSFFFWHVFVEGLPAGVHYTWRMDGPGDTAATGRRFHPDRELLDPWAHAVSDAVWDRARACAGQDAGPNGFRGIVVEPLPPATGAAAGFSAVFSLSWLSLYSLARRRLRSSRLWPLSRS